MMSRASQYGVLAAVHLAGRADNAFVPVRAVAEELELSPHFLAKIVQQAASKGIFRSYRGPNGGVALGRPATDITVADIIGAIDGLESFERCVLGLPGCGSEKPCPMHAAWSEIRGDTVRMLGTTTVARLAADMEKGGLRLRSEDVLGTLRNLTKE